MSHLRGLRAGQIRNGARHLQRPVRAAPGPAQSGCGHVQKLDSRFVQPNMGVNLLALSIVIGLSLALHSQRSGLGATLANQRAGLARCGMQQLCGLHAVHFHV